MTGESWFPRCSVGIVGTIDDGTSASRAPVPVFVTPQRAVVRLNGYQKPDEYAVTFDAKAFPFRPEIIKRADLSIHMWAGRAVDEDWRAHTNRETMMVTGRAHDRITMRLSSDGRTYDISGADYTFELSRHKWDPARRFNAHGKLLVNAVAELVAEVPTVANLLTVVFEGPEDGLYLGPRVTEAGQIAPQRKKKKSKKPPPTVVRAEGMAVKQGRSYWDVINQVCLENGHIVFVRGEEVVITTHANQKLIAAERPDMRFFAWGENLTRLEMDRDLSIDGVKQQVARFWDPAVRQMVEVRHPESFENEGTGRRAQNHEIALLPSGITSRDRALDYLKEKFESQSRGQTRITFTTRSCRDLRERDVLTGLRAGSPVVVGFDALGTASLASLSPAERFRAINAMGFPEGVAQKLRDAYEGLRETERTLYVRESTFTWDAREGITVDCECVNYVFPRRDEQPSDRLMGLETWGGP